MTGVLVVTGASRGIGEATALAAAAQGYAVCVNYRSDTEKAQEVANRIISDGGKAITVAADVSQEDDVVRVFKTVDDELGPVTALVNNAGVVPNRYRADEIPYEDMAMVLLTNAGGTILCCREALCRMLPKYGGQGGAIVNVSSMSSTLGAAHYWVHYGASKGAVDAYTIGLAKEVAGEGIRVNAVRPGLIDTEMHARSGQPDRVAKIAERQPMKRAAAPEEVAAGILWLLSDEASYVSGDIMNIAGGL
ncbi:MAG: NAD(P)-dependent oxidoreductase [Alphaproteobacteria bacterium]|nr:NAD(P)-dependent oxidoreductase [Alphaproteobacteria bacterium]|tara:strand:+ start:2181 stop:2927 length:747 start_codon:yes stop_codon:yes gene_type:complete